MSRRPLLRTLAAAIGLALASAPIEARAEPRSLEPGNAAASASDDLSTCRGAASPAQAVAACTRLIESGLNSPAALSGLHRCRAGAYLAMRDEARAFADFDEAIRLDPKDADAWAARGQAHQWLGAHDLAIADLDQAGRRARRNADFLNDRCWARAVAGVELDAARRLCDRALRLRPDNPAYLDSRALVELTSHRFERAFADYDASLRWSPESAHALFGRGLAAIALARRAEGEADLARAIAMDPGVDDQYRRYGVSPELLPPQSPRQTPPSSP